MKFAVLFASALLFAGCGVKHIASTPPSAPALQGFYLKFDPPVQQKPNLFCDPDWVPQEEITIIECKEPIVECDEGQSMWHPWQDVCPNKI